MEILSSLKQRDIFDLKVLNCFHGYDILLVTRLFTVYLAFCLAIRFQEQNQELKILTINPLGTGQQEFLYFK